MSIQKVQALSVNPPASSPTNSSAQTQSTSSVPPFLPGYANKMAEFVSAHAFGPGGGTPASAANAGTSSTFGSNSKPEYNPSLPTDLGSNNGRIAANSTLRLEQLDPGYEPQAEAQLVAQTLGQHKNDLQFLQQYLGTLGSNRVASMFSYLGSPGNVQTPETDLAGTATPQQLKQEYSNMADSLSTLVKNKDFSQSDMDQFAGQFAKTNPQVNFFAKNVLSQASPEVNQMFYQSAKNYALGNSGSSNGQSMAAYAMQALSQTSNPMLALENLPKSQLSTLVSTAMKGEAAYGNPPTVDEFAKTGIFRPQDGKGDPLNGLSNLMFDAAYSDAGDPQSPAPLSIGQAQDLQTRLFQAAVGTLQSDPNVKSFYQGSVPMKDALSVDFQQGYDSIVKAYSGKDGELSSQGMSAFREFFADAVFSPPPSNYALGSVAIVQDKLSKYVAMAANKAAGEQASPEEQNYAESLGEQAEAMAAGLQESFASILSGAAESDQNTQNLLNGIISVGGAAVGAFGGAPGGMGSAIIGQALSQLVNSNSGSGPSDIQAAIKELASHGLNVNSDSLGAFHNLETNILNYSYRSPLQAGFDTAAIYYNDGPIAGD